MSTYHNHDSQDIVQEGELTGLKKFTQYQVTIKAKNSAAFGPATDPVLVRTSEGGETIMLSIKLWNAFHWSSLTGLREPVELFSN